MNGNRFVFSGKRLQPESTYNVEFVSSSNKQPCRISNASGTIREGRITRKADHNPVFTGGDVSNVEVDCQPIPGPCDTINDAWFHLYEHDNFGGRNLRNQYNVGYIANYHDIRVGDKGFNDKVSAARSCIPQGWIYRLYKHNTYKGSCRDLTGTDAVEEENDFHAKNIGFGDETSSSSWLDCSIDNCGGCQDLPIYPSRLNTCSTIQNSWVQLYQDNKFKRRNFRLSFISGDVIFDYDDITVGGKKGFGDKTSSAKWCMPYGWAYRLYDGDSLKSHCLDLKGKGSVTQIQDFDYVHASDGKGFGDKTSSSKWVNCAQESCNVCN